jgi:hypothetical protein
LIGCLKKWGPKALKADFVAFFLLLEKPTTFEVEWPVFYSVGFYTHTRKPFEPKKYGLKSKLIFSCAS